MSSLFEDDARFSTWLNIELTAAETMAEEGMIPKKDFEVCKKKASFNAARIHEIEKEVKHDVIAFLTSVNESIGPESRVLHFGMTSSDLIDTAFAITLKKAGTLILSGVDAAIEALTKRAKEFQYLPAIGRSHGIHAEPLTFGIKFLTYVSEFKRQRARLLSAIEDISYGTLSGAVGTFSSLSPSLEEKVLTKLGLKAEPIATQVVPRDRHAYFFSTLALIAASIERCAVEIRHLQRTEVREVEESFSVGQKGSSAMPHKKNPILSENLTGLSRLMRSYAQAAFENIALWHERDISHSSVERVIAPDACIVLDFMLSRFAGLISGLKVFEDNVTGNLNRTRKLYASGSVLVALTDSGMSREDAYKKVQTHALAAWESAPDLEERLLADKDVTKVLASEKIKELCGIEKHLKHIDEIFGRVLGN